MDKNDLHKCRVCGFQSVDFPWGIDGKTSSFDICECCNVEFGYEDITINSIRKYRKLWLERGGSFHDKKKMPPNWSLEDQLLEILPQYM